jgi:hypothetical protein
MGFDYTRERPVPGHARRARCELTGFSRRWVWAEWANETGSKRV